MVGVRVRRAEHIVGWERSRVAEHLRARYVAGATIRDLATETGRSYHWVRGMLLKAGVVLRARGGDRSGDRRAGPKATP